MLCRLLLEDGRLNYIYQPGQQMTYSTDVLQPGQTFWSDYYRLIPEITGTLDLTHSFVAKTGGNVTVPSTITTTLAPTSNARTFEESGDSPLAVTFEALRAASLSEVTRFAFGPDGAGGAVAAACAARRAA